MSSPMKALKDFVKYDFDVEEDVFADKDEAFEEAGNRGDDWFVICYYPFNKLDCEFAVTCEANRRI